MAAMLPGAPIISGTPTTLAVFNQVARMLEILEQISPDSSQINLLVELVAALRPAKPDISATPAVRTLCQLLQGQPQQALRLRQYILCILASRRHTSLYTDVGIHSNDGFFSELMRHISYCILPPALEEQYLADALDQILFVKTDYQWINAVPIEQWLVLFDLLQGANEAEAADEAGGTDQAAPMRAGMLEAVRTLSYRICAIGLEPKLLHIHADIEKFESPFLMQNLETNAWLASQAPPAALNTGSTSTSSTDSMTEPTDARHLLVMLDQCTTVIGKIRKNALHQGTSIALTYLLVVLTQSIARLQKLLLLLEPAPTAEPEARRTAAMALAQELIEAHNKKYALRELFANNLNLLARNVTENASRTGEHYIAETRQVLRAMFVSSAGAGAIISVMAMLKILASYLRAAPIAEAFIYSLNYSFGFMLIHVLHFTVATKQPAMTAATIAAGLQSKDGRHIDLGSMAELIIKVWRTQLAAVLGNLATAMPLAFVIALLYGWLSGQALVTPEKALHLLDDIDTLHSPALWYAMIAGVCLFIAGLISGYYDNLALYSRMACRVTQVRLLGRVLGARRHKRLANYLENNLGGLMGNFYFGILLGSIGTLGDMLGIAIDIRHITFSSANFATALVGLDYRLSWQQVLTSLFGIASIGAMNLFVSFSLALTVALRSRQARFGQTGALLHTLLQRFTSSPRDFFITPAPALVAAAAVPATTPEPELIAPKKDNFTP
jgi:site-specific recombinase